MPGDSGVLVYSCAFYQSKVHTSLRVQRAPGVPRALCWAEASCTTRAHRAAGRRLASEIRATSLRAKRSNPSRRIKKEWIASSQVLLAMTMSADTTPHPRGAKRPGCAKKPSAQRGRGECRMPAAPAASCALCIGRTHTSKRVHRNHPAFPHAMVLTVSFVLPGEPGSFATVAHGLTFCPHPVGADITSANLTPASGRQDHTTSPSAATSFVSSPFDRSRIPWRTRPASRCAPDTAASTASLPASVTIAIRPSVGWDGANL